MSGCVEFQSSMTGSTRAGPPKPPEDSAPLLPVAPASSSSSRSSSSGGRNSENARQSPHRRNERLHQKMTPVRPTSGQPIQLTPLWEHVVRTQRFPTEVDTGETFDEISERLRDPEWEVRQHALRVLVDVLPTLGDDAVDIAMTPVLPELVNNLGHLAPAVRKGALDTLRVYLVCSRKKEEIVRGILNEGLSRSDCLDSFQTNVTLGVILSTPSLLFPSSSSPRPSKQILREAIDALATRLVQVTHQEATIRSLAKIHDILGDEEFDSYLCELDVNARRDYDLLCDVYKVKSDDKNLAKKNGRSTAKGKKELANGIRKKREDLIEERNNELNGNWECPSKASGSDVNDEKVVSIDSNIPTARIVLETEIKFNEETAITMTILEEKNDESEEDDDDESNVDSGEELAKDEDIILNDNEKNSIEDSKNVDEVQDAWIERRKTPRRVHFGGEVVKLRTPDSEDSEIVQREIPQTRIPLPISPTTRMPVIRSRRSLSNPCSPNVSKSGDRKSRSVSNSPRREFYTHDASLSPKKSILSRASVPSSIRQSIADSTIENEKMCKKIVNDKIDKFFGKEENDRGWAFEICDNDRPMNVEIEKDMSDVPNNTSSSNKQVKAEEEISSTVNNDRKDTKKISNVEVNENVKVEKIELVKSSEMANREVESFVVDAEDKHESGESESREAINSSATKAEEARDTREVGEKLPYSTREGNAESLSDSQRRCSPSRSPKKLVFESFPRMERNYILMELSSPTKTSTRKINDTNEIVSSDSQQRLSVPINDTAFSRGNSPIGKSADHMFVDPNVPNVIIENPKNQDENSKKIVEKLSPDDKFIKKNEVIAEKSEDIADANENDRASPILNIVGDSPGKLRESNWEELGLVDQEVLNDLHNKDDWRARVRGLERVASALRTSSALIAIEPRLGSLLQAVLGGERSCRVAAAGMSVARVVVAGVSEEALKRRLPQVAWGLARQGGPNAAQLARVAMLRLRPALLLEQLLQPHCIKARNAKTRENALQLLIFSLVTFPSTEFKGENVASKVATMVFDRRRRVRQAALDTLAVLAQIYEPEEVMQAGKLAAKGQQDGDAMIAAIRARLARKSLPMVSADGLVVYGLQISPTVQIATGPDVDWIVAGSGSVSPGTGRTRGQIIATTTRQGVHEKNVKNESMKNVANSKGPNFVALGIGLNSKNEEQPFAWQLVNHSTEDDGKRIQEKLWEPKNRDNTKIGKNNHDVKSRLTGSLRHYRSATERLDDSFETETTPIFLLDDKDVIMKQRKTEENFHRRMDEIYADRTGIVPTSRDVTGNRLESRIPVPHSKDREIHSKETRIGTNYARRRIQDGNNSQNWSAESRGSEDSRPRSNQRNDKLQTEINDSPRYQGISRDNSPLRHSQTRDTYRSIYRQRRGFADGNVYREVQTAPTTTSYDVSRRRRSLKDLHDITDGRRVSTDVRASNDTRTNRRRETADSYGVLNPSGRNGDKAIVDEEDNNDINKHHFSAQTKPCRISNLNDRSSQCSARINNGPSETSSNSSSNVSGEEIPPEISQNIEDEQRSIEESYATSINESYRISPVKSPMVEKSFDVITHESNPSRRNSIEYGISENNVDLSTVVYSTDLDNEEEDTDKGSSTDDAPILPRLQSSHENYLESRENDDEDSSEIENTRNRRSAYNVSTSFVTNGSNSSDGGISKVSDDSPTSNESGKIVVETSNIATSPARIDSLYAIRSIETVEFDNSGTSMDENDGPDFTMAFVREYPKDLSNENSPTIRGTSVQVDNDSSLPEFFFQAEEQRKQLEEVEDEIGAVGSSVGVLVASRPHSREPLEYEDASFQPLDFVESREVIGNSALSRIVATSARPPSGRANESPKKSNFIAISPNEISQNFHRDSAATREKINRTASIGNENAITLSEVNGSQSVTSEKSEQPKRVATSRLSQIRQKNRTNVARVAPMPGGQSNDRNPTKSKSTTQQCIAQLESNDWEVTVKGLKALSQIARQQPEQLDACGPGTLGRLLGRHVRNLRSQVSRAACLAAGAVFGSQARCIDQELDDIAGPLLHRTADTNKFLRADSNEALDRMVEHLTPNKTILVIVHRGASHQNAIVRAATARLLASIIDRIGPEAVMSLPRDVREKFIASGAKLLMDGNLDARNHAKRIFRKLGRCEGFRKALKDSVPEATLRHIDKTLKSL